MPLENFGTISATALLVSTGVMTVGGCFNAGDDLLETSSEVGGADYGGPDVGEEVFDTDGEVDTGTSESESESTSDTSDTSSDTSDTSSDTSSDTTDTGGPATCGWFEANAYYECGYEGTDPGGTPIECPPGLVAGDPCMNTGLTQVGCCDANADNWYCDGNGMVFFNDCQ